MAVLHKLTPGTITSTIGTPHSTRKNAQLAVQECADSCAFRGEFIQTHLWYHQFWVSSLTLGNPVASFVNTSYHPRSKILCLAPFSLSSHLDSLPSYHPSFSAVETTLSYTYSQPTGLPLISHSNLLRRGETKTHIVNLNTVWVFPVGGVFLFPPLMVCTFVYFPLSLLASGTIISVGRQTLINVRSTY